MDARVSRAAAGLGIVMRKIPPDAIKKILEAPLRILSRGERAIRDILKDKTLCVGVNSGYVDKILAQYDPTRGNNIYLGFSIFPRTRGTPKKHKPTPGFRFVGLVTIGPARFIDSFGDCYRFMDDEMNAAADSGQMRELDLICSKKDAPPMAATVLVAKAISDDLMSTVPRPKMYMLERSIRGPTAPIDATARRLGFRNVGSIYDVERQTKLWIHMVMKDPSTISKAIPRHYENAIDMDEICEPGGCF